MVLPRLLLVAFAFLAVTTPASARTVACKAGEYGYYDKGEFPVVYKLRAVNLPKRIDGVASRCEVADAVAGAIQDGFSDTEELPGSVHPTGGDSEDWSEWDAGVFICVYKEEQGEYVPYMVAKCHRKGKKTQRVTMELGS